jgi:tetratricopeptide (TPR) repeat protein
MKSLSSDLGVMYGRSFESKVAIFDESDLSFVERVKELDISMRVKGLSLYLKALRNHDGALQSQEYLLKSFFVFEKALENHPKDAWLQARMGDVCTEMFHSMEKSGRRRAGTVGEREVFDLLELFQEKAQIYYRNSLSLNGDDPFIVYNYCRFLVYKQQYSEAEPLMDKALQMLADTQDEKHEQLKVAAWKLKDKIALRSAGSLQNLASSVGGVSSFNNSKAPPKSPRKSVDFPLKKSPRISKSFQKLGEVLKRTSSARSSVVLEEPEEAEEDLLELEVERNKMLIERLRKSNPQRGVLSLEHMF